MKEAEAIASSNDFNTVHHITKQVACGYKPFDGPVSYVNCTFIIHQLPVEALPHDSETHNF